MSRIEFDEFIRRQQSASVVAEDAFDPQRQLDEWREHLGVLYGQIRKFMAKYLERRLADIQLKEITLNEEFSGPYTVSEMTLKFGKSTVVLTPVGTMLIGSKGRVDVRGPRGTARLGLVGKNVSSASQLVSIKVFVPGTHEAEPKRDKGEKIEWAWKIITPAPSMQFVELTEDSFFDMILSVADG